MPLYVLFQAIPLPGIFVDLISPARGALEQMLSGFDLQSTFNPVSVFPARTLEHALRFVGYALMLLMVRELAMRRGLGSWLLAAPLLAVAGMQALAGLFQVQGGDPVALGGYANRNHFAGLLELALPFAPAMSFAALQKSSERSSTLDLRAALLASLGWALAALLMGGVLLSLSRAGFVIALLGLAQVVLFRYVPLRLSVKDGLRNLGVLIALLVILAAAIIFLPTDALIDRFGDLAASDEISHDSRVAMWTETLRLIKDYWLVGCGLGAYGSAFVAYRASSPMFQIPYAHNDFLQYLGELGVVGFAIGFVPIVILWVRLLRRFERERDANVRCMALGCLVSMHSLALHSLVDFNLYIPANALIFAWVLGVSAALTQDDFSQNGGIPRQSRRKFMHSSRRPE
ncbi:MAG: hypothetical protein GC160_05770 [Acidobacteria bacterium]|nr:hypothetical protein [Acidobacteriota bacterium]